MLYKIHQIREYFVIRSKTNQQLQSYKKETLNAQKCAFRPDDQIDRFLLKKVLSRSTSTGQIIEWTEREFVFLTNTTYISVLQVAELYKNRWQVGIPTSEMPYVFVFIVLGDNTVKLTSIGKEDYLGEN